MDFFSHHHKYKQLLFQGTAVFSILDEWNSVSQRNYSLIKKSWENASDCHSRNGKKSPGSNSINNFQKLRRRDEMQTVII